MRTIKTFKLFLLLPLTLALFTACNETEFAQGTLEDTGALTTTNTEVTEATEAPVNVGAIPPAVEIVSEGNNDVVATEDVIEEKFICESKSKVLKSKQEVELKFDISETFKDVNISFISENNEKLGSVGEFKDNKVTYKAPDSVQKDAKILIKASTIHNEIEKTAVCEVTLIADKALGVEDDNILDGIVGKVYSLNSGTNMLPDFSLKTAESSIVIPNFDIPTRAFEEGFPGVASLYEWFGIQFKARLKIDKAGEYQFRLRADDGANFYINGKKIIDNDGVHAPRNKDGKVTLEKGLYDITLDYFQGPRYHISLQLFWILPESNEDFKVVPNDKFSRPVENKKAE